MLKKAYGNDGMKKTAVYEWHKRFREGQKQRESDVGVFFDYDYVIHYEFIPEGQTVNKDLYLEILKQLRDAIRRKRPENWATNDWFLLHDNALPHRALIVKKYLARHSVTTLEHPPYSTDLAPADFYPFPRLKKKLKGHRSVHSDEVIENATKQLKDLSKNGFQECFEQLYERWKKCVDAGGKYFEGQ
ncbi:Histone-lysine N-methyltransferase SETMAR [Araneus ventricosus]|uniref:Histone-lysine N-methyltransferase SETMAR n=1 Tax=Araneus ventricosus TaxID=182803 RepID=A0A4Y2CWC3_ARAVE|nr:Histone-lysine N-methyltransferase SETMAR [Araneus ventricosus]